MAKRLMSNRKKKLLRRDGDKCWLCDKFMPINDRTVEHLIARSQGGRSNLDNLVLTHERCNLKLGSKSLKNKIKLVRQLSPDRSICAERDAQRVIAGEAHWLRNQHWLVK